MAKAYRIVQPKFADTAFDGEGARRFGGRWNNRGTRVAYTSASASLAVLESFVHMGVDMRDVDHILIEIEIPDELIYYVDDKDLPEGWNDNPYPIETAEFGSTWAKEGKNVVLSVPSTIMAMERNYIINPEHEDFKKIKIVSSKEFRYDERMWK